MKIGHAVHGWVQRWWAGEAGSVGLVASVALAPAEWLFRGVVHARDAAYRRGLLSIDHAAIPVISVGNLSVGGTGKTPFTAWLADRLAGWGARPAVVLRGYGADEVLVHQELNPGIPTFIARVRAEAAAAAAASGCTVAVLDDAFQHRALARDLDIVLISAGDSIRNKAMLPRGPWRESAAALSRADVVVSVHKGAASAGPPGGGLGPVPHDSLLVSCAIVPDGVAPLQGGAPQPLSSLAGRQVLAPAGIAHPGQFAADLRAAGVAVELVAFPDHHDFSADDARQLVARAAGRALVMTRKDAVKLRPLVDAKGEAYVLDQIVQITRGEKELDQKIQRALERPRP